MCCWFRLHPSTSCTMDPFANIHGTPAVCWCSVNFTVSQTKNVHLELDVSRHMRSICFIVFEINVLRGIITLMHRQERHLRTCAGTMHRMLDMCVCARLCFGVSFYTSSALSLKWIWEIKFNVIINFPTENETIISLATWLLLFSMSHCVLSASGIDTVQ